MAKQKQRVLSQPIARSLAAFTAIASIAAIVVAYRFDKLDLSGFGQASGVIVACAALLVAVLAVDVTQRIADEIRSSGLNSDLVNASANIQKQWQELNLAAIRQPELTRKWEANNKEDKALYFDERLALCFYMLQILKLSKLYEDAGIIAADQTVSSRYWSHSFTTLYADVWEWIKANNRGFPDDTHAAIEKWAAEYQASRPASSNDH